MKKNISSQIISSCFKKNWLLILIIFLLIIVCSLLSLVNPIIYKMIIDDFIPSKRIGSLLLPLLIMVLVPWVIVFLSSLKNYLLSTFSTNLTGSLRKACFNKCLHAKQDQLEKILPTQIVNRITKECGRIGEVYFTNDLASFASELIYLISILITMFIYDIKLTLICCIAFPISFLLTKVVSKRSKKIDKELLEHMENGQVYLSNTLRKIKTIKLKNGYSVENSRWDTWLLNYKRLKQHASVTHNINRFLVGDLIINVLYGILFFISGVMVINNQLTIGELVIFVSYVPKVYSSLRNVLNIKVSTEVIENSFQKIDELMEFEQEGDKGVELNVINSIDICNVDFSYPRGDFHLANFNLNIKKGEKIGIVGTSGGGKSTIFDLITHLYSIQKGSILINDCDISSYNVNSLRNRISIVTQNVDLFEETIMYNMVYPEKDIDDFKISNILHVVHLDELITRLPDGFNTYVGESGDLLSGGEKQRIAIANALLQDSDIVLLDEFTSALDAKIEKELIEYIMQIPDKTVIMISHRIYNIMMCNNILVVSDGKIIEQGNPKSLLSNSQSEFSKLYSNLTY